MFNLGVIGTVDMAEGGFDGIVKTARTIIWLVSGVGMAFVFYTWIRSGSS